MTEQPQQPYTVAEYIVDRLAALGVRHVFHVPGNYSAQFLITAQASGKLVCIGTTNEMEAGYAADAYARLRGIGVACVTYGVGSFSLLNAIAGAYVERCPVVLINGSANADKASQLVSQGVLFAHAIDTIRTDESIFRHVTADTAVIAAPEDAPAHIDRVLRACITHKQPVYLEVRDGVWQHTCDRPADAETPLPPFQPDPQTDRDIEQSVRAAAVAVRERLRAAEQPVLWGGEELQRYGVEDEFEQLVQITELPYATTLLGKSVVSERNEYFVGVYDSRWAPEDTAQVVEGSDCLIALGTIPTDFYGDIIGKSYDRMVLAAGNAVRIGRAIYPNVPLDRFMSALVAELEADYGRPPTPLADAAAAGPERPQHTPPPGFEAARRADKHQQLIKQLVAERPARQSTLAADTAAALTSVAPVASSPQIEWESFFRRMHEFVDEQTFVLADTSLGLFPAAELLVAKRSHFIVQAAWLSIGYTVGAVVGVSMLLPQEERAVVFAGDGGFQMLAQAFSTLVRHRRRDIIFVFDNQLYAIEQFLVDRTYYQDPQKPSVFFNELPHWDYVKLAEAFGGKGYNVATVAELDDALGEARGLTDVPALIAVKLDPRLLPPELAQALRPAAAALAAPKPTGFGSAGFN
jgi:indolepyruvate decarboxylase